MLPLITATCPFPSVSIVGRSSHAFIILSTTSLFFRLPVPPSLLLSSSGSDKEKILKERKMEECRGWSNKCRPAEDQCLTKRRHRCGHVGS